MVQKVNRLSKGIKAVWAYDPFRDTIKRAVNTFCQTLVSLLLVAGAVGVGAIAWQTLLSVSLLATLISILQSIIRYTETKSEGDEDDEGDNTTPTGDGPNSVALA